MQSYIQTSDMNERTFNSSWSMAEGTLISVLLIYFRELSTSCCSVDEVMLNVLRCQLTY